MTINGLGELIRIQIDFSSEIWFAIAALLVLQIYLWLAPESGPKGR